MARYEYDVVGSKTFIEVRHKGQNSKNTRLAMETVFQGKLFQKIPTVRTISYVKIMPYIKK